MVYPYSYFDFFRLLLQVDLPIPSALSRSFLCQVRALRLESYRPPKKKRALSLDSVLPNDAPPNAAAVANSENSNSDNSNSTSNGNSNNTNNNNNSSSNDNTSSRRRGKSQERADRLSDDAGAAGAVVATREGSRRSRDGNTCHSGGNSGNNSSGSGNSGENSNATNTARGSRESRESLELPCAPFDEVADPRGPAWVKAWDREGAKALDAAFAKADLENDK